MMPRAFIAALFTLFARPGASRALPRSRIAVLARFERLDTGLTLLSQLFALALAGRATRSLIAALALFCLGCASAHAHKPSDSYLSLRVTGARIDGQWDIALRDLDAAIGLDLDGDGALTWDEIRGRHQAIARYALARLDLASEQGACPARAGEQLIDHHTDGAYTVLRFSAVCPAAVGAITIDYRLFADIDAQHKGLVRIASGERTTSAIFGADHARQRLALAQPGPIAQFDRYVEHGLRHIWTGFDHLLFLLSLLLPSVLPAAVAPPARRIGARTGMRIGACTGMRIGARTGMRIGACTGMRIGACTGMRIGACTGMRIGACTGMRVGACTGMRIGACTGRHTGTSARAGAGAATGGCLGAGPGILAVFADVLKVVTAFTLAHSLTLTLASLHVLALPARLIESAIAASVAVAALNNLAPLLRGRRPLAAFAFGLIHGFGFAGVLADLGLPRPDLLLSLFGFNAGVELGQTAIVGLFVPLAFALRRTWLYRQMLTTGSALIALAGAAWFVERAFDLKLLAA